MGYYINQRGCDFYIAKEDFPKGLELLNGILDQAEAKGEGLPTKGEQIIRHFSWVLRDAAKEAIQRKDLIEAMKNCRWHLDLDENGNVFSIEFNGEKYGGDEIYILNAIAPIVKKDSYIEMQGEEGEIWRWVFDGEHCKEVVATIEFR